MLEGIEDPYNFGYAVRSLYAAGADAIVLSPQSTELVLVGGLLRDDPAFPTADPETVSAH